MQRLDARHCWTMCGNPLPGIGGARSPAAVTAFKWTPIVILALLLAIGSHCTKASSPPDLQATGPAQNLPLQLPAAIYTTTLALSPASGTDAGGADLADAQSIAGDYELLILHNAHIQVAVAPELGGRIIEIQDKKTGRDQLYASQTLTLTASGQLQPVAAQEAAPPAGLQAISWCLPGPDQGFAWDMAWSWSAITSTHGATITLVADASQGPLQAQVSLYLPDDGAYLVVQPRLENTGTEPAAFTLSTYAPSPTFAPADPEIEMAAGAPRYAYGAEFSSVYDPGEGAGFVRAAGRDAPEGYAGFAAGWDPAWTCGLQESGGRDRATHVSMDIPAGGALTWREVWYAVRDLGAVIAATDRAALGATRESDTWQIAVQPVDERTGHPQTLTVWHAATCAELARWTDLSDEPAGPLHYSLPADDPKHSADVAALAINVDDRDGNSLVSHGPTDCKTLSVPPPHIYYGINVQDQSHIDALVPTLGLGWVKLWEEYPESRLPLTTPIAYDILYNVNCGAYVNDLTGWRGHVQATANAGLGVVDAYEICNESNVRNANWGGNAPDPVRFTEMLCIAYDEIKTIDAEAWVVSGGLAPVGRITSSACGPGNDCTAMDELEYLDSMLDSGAGACMDAFGYHPYGFASAPEQDPDNVENAFAFRGMENLRAILVNHGLTTLPVWATELNWLRRPADDGYEFDCHNDGDYQANFLWQEVSAQTQADYLVRAFQYADTHWPWMQGMFVWNLDWHDYLTWLPCFHSRYYALRRHTGSELGAATLAYEALSAMEKRPGPVQTTPILMVTPLMRTVWSDALTPQVLQTSFTILNTGVDTLTWKVTRLPTSTLPAVLSSIWGPQGRPLTVTVDTNGLHSGTYTGIYRIDALPDTTQHTPQIIQVILNISSYQRVYLPVILRQAAPPPAEPVGPSKIGIHAIGEGGTLGLVQTVADAGAHVAVVKGVSSFGYLCDVKDISPDTITIGRWAEGSWETIVPTGDPAEKARDYLNTHMAAWLPYRDCVDYWEVLNEVDPDSSAGHTWLAEFYKAAMPIAEAQGYKLALFSYSLGVPEIYEWQAIAQTGVFAQAQAGGHILALHEYGWPHMDDLWGEPLPQYPGQDPQDPANPRYPDRGVVTGRYRHLYRDILIPRGEVIPLVITETNLAIEDPVERALYFLDEIAWYDDRLREDDYVLGMTIFTLGGISGWDQFDFAEFLPDLAARIIALKDE